jgi:surface carbohydrate biosynthesis protein
MCRGRGASIFGLGLEKILSVIMKTIYFHIDELRRDAGVASVILKECQARGWKLYMGNRVSSKILRYFEWCFDLIILPKPVFIKTIFSESQLNSLQSKYLILYTENVGIVANDLYPKLVCKNLLSDITMSGEESLVKRIDAFALWGRQVKSVVIKEFPKLANKFTVVGHPRHDKRLLPKMELNKKSSQIGVITRFCSLNDYYNRTLVNQIFSKYLSENSLIDFEFYNKKTDEFLLKSGRGINLAEDIYIESLEMIKTIEIIRMLAISGFKVSIKVHPRENTENWSKILSIPNVELADNSEAFVNWAANKTCIIGPPSTSFYDSMMLGVPPISIHKMINAGFNHIKIFDEVNNKLMDYVDSPHDLEELLSLIQSYNKNGWTIGPGAAEVLLNETNFPKSKNSGVNIASLIENLINDNKTSSMKKMGYIFYNCVMLGLNYFGEIINILNIKKTNSAYFFMTVKKQNWIKNICQTSKEGR